MDLDKSCTTLYCMNLGMLNSYGNSRDFDKRCLVRHPTHTLDTPKWLSLLYNFCLFFSSIFRPSARDTLLDTCWTREESCHHDQGGLLSSRVIFLAFLFSLFFNLLFFFLSFLPSVGHGILSGYRRKRERYFLPTLAVEQRMYGSCMRTR